MNTTNKGNFLAILLVNDILVNEVEYSLPSLAMPSVACGLDELLCALLCEFNVELSIVIPFPTPSEALRVGT